MNASSGKLALKDNYNSQAMNDIASPGVHCEMTTATKHLFSTVNGSSRNIFDNAECSIL